MRYVICLILLTLGLGCSPSAPTEEPKQDSLGGSISRFFENGSDNQAEAMKSMKEQQEERLKAHQEEQKKAHEERERIYDNQKYFQHQE